MRHIEEGAYELRHLLDPKPTKKEHIAGFSVLQDLIQNNLG